jgi:hypothetical protein
MDDFHLIPPFPAIAIVIESFPRDSSGLRPGCSLQSPLPNFPKIQISLARQNDFSKSSFLCAESSMAQKAPDIDGAFVGFDAQANKGITLMAQQRIKEP